MHPPQIENCTPFEGFYQNYGSLPKSKPRLVRTGFWYYCKVRFEGGREWMTARWAVRAATRFARRWGIPPLPPQKCCKCRVFAGFRHFFLFFVYFFVIINFTKVRVQDAEPERSLLSGRSSWIFLCKLLTLSDSGEKIIWKRTFTNTLQKLTGRIWKWMISIHNTPTLSAFSKQRFGFYIRWKKGKYLQADLCREWSYSLQTINTAIKNMVNTQNSFFVRF